MNKTCLRDGCPNSFDASLRDPKKYCSRSCSTIVNNTKTKTRSHRSKSICQNVYCSAPSVRPSNYCSGPCKREQETLVKAHIALQTGEPQLATQSTIKKLLLFIRGHQCEMSDCMITIWKDGPVPLVMDHINGDAGDNSLTNLRLVCGNCDMLLPTYKSKNKGKGRHQRAQRYRDGKSH